MTAQADPGAAYDISDLHDLGDLHLDRSDDLLRGGPGRKIRPIPTGRYSVEVEPKPYRWRDPARLSARVSQGVSRIPWQ